MHEISIKPEVLFHIGNFALTNSIFLGVCVVLLLLIVGGIGARRLQTVPGRFQGIFEMLMEQALGFMDSVLGERKKSLKYFPIVMTIFLFVVASNWLGLFPFNGPIGLIHKKTHTEELAQSIETVHENPFDQPTALKEESVQEKQEDIPIEEKHPALTPLFRAPTSDLNFTIGLAIIAVLAVNVLGVGAIGVGKHFGKFFNFKSPIMFFVGILELISEFVKIISFSFRLFGNIFAGEVLLVIIAFLVPYIVPLPFLFLEVFVGFIQGFIFAMLTLVFISMAVVEHDEAH